MEHTPAADDQARLRSAMTRKLLARSIAQGSISLPAVPAMLDEYVEVCLNTFSAIGVQFDDDQKAHLRSALDSQLLHAFAESPRSTILIAYESPVGNVVNYHVTAQWLSLDQAYDNWVATREPPLFGIHPDAQVMACADACRSSHDRVLDVGAGTGRNSLPLARRGHPVDAIELSPKFAEILRVQAAEENLNVTVIERDVFDAEAKMHRDYGLIVVSEVASDFRTEGQLRRLFHLAGDCLAPGGQLVMNLFLAKPGYEPDAAARQLGQQTYTAIFTRNELALALAGAPLVLLSDEPVLAFERTHQPADAWPPTSWYENWVTGRDVFDTSATDSPIELRWLVFGSRTPVAE